MTIKKISELIEPSLDAIDYRAKEKKQFFSNSYVATSFLKKACESNCYYFIGEKGTGKTALAFHMQNSQHQNIAAKLISISETQYTRFINLKISGKLEYTDYSIIWRATLLYLVAKLAIEKHKKWHHKINGKFSKIEAAIKKYDKDSQIPELEYVIEFVTTLTQDASLSTNVPELVKLGVKEGNSQSTKTTTTELKTALLECEKILKAGLQGIKLNSDIALLIDGLDAKPNGIEFTEYQKCLIGLSEAAWHLNSEFFSAVKDSPGRMRCVLLLRPDVFDSLNMHNSNCRLADNSVIFHWNTTHEQHKASDLYCVSNKYFTAQCGDKHGWNEYFGEISSSGSDSFKEIMKNSFHRPRDVFSAIKTLINIAEQTGTGDSTQFELKTLKSARFTELYSDYLLGEVKNYANYYITNSEFDCCTAFFQHLNGAKNFDFEEFCTAYECFINSPGNIHLKSTKIASSAEAFLQFWYDVNVIGYTEELQKGGSNHYHWAMRERSASKVMPKIKHNCQYLIQSGVAKSLDIGKRFKAPV